MKNKAKKLVNVITPSPPICMRMMSTVKPVGVKVAAISSGERPVTHTALVLRKMESYHVMPSNVLFGSFSSTAPTMIITKKLPARINDGLVRFPSSRTMPLERSSSEMTIKMVSR